MSLGKNMKLATWDGLVWYPQVYDADTTIGLDKLIVQLYSNVKI